MWIKSSVCGPCKKESPKLSIIIMELSGTNDHCTCYLLVSTGFFLQTRIQSCRSQRIWALPSSTPSRCMLPWPILSSSTCVCWTSTLNLPCLATLASSAQLVRIINKNPVFKNIHMTFWSSHLALWFSVKSHHPPVSMQDLPPDLWTWPRKWSRLGWTLQEWTSPMEHMRWVRKHQQLWQIIFGPARVTSRGCRIGKENPAVTSRVSVCAKVQHVPRRSSIAVFSSPTTNDSVWIYPLQLQPSVWHYSCGPVTVCGCNVIYELVLAPLQWRVWVVACDLVGELNYSQLFGPPYTHEPSPLKVMPLYLFHCHLSGRAVESISSSSMTTRSWYLDA